MSFQRGDNLYSFTQENGPYTKLPIGKEAVIIGVSIQNDSVFYASQKINIEDNLKLNVNMKYVPKSSLNDSLAFALNQPM